jgi:hypothetical protein
MRVYNRATVVAQLVSGYVMDYRSLPLNSTAKQSVLSRTRTKLEATFIMALARVSAMATHSKISINPRFNLGLASISAFFKLKKSKLFCDFCTEASKVTIDCNLFQKGVKRIARKIEARFALTRYQVFASIKSFSPLVNYSPNNSFKKNIGNQLRSALRCTEESRNTNFASPCSRADQVDNERSSYSGVVIHHSTHHTLKTKANFNNLQSTNQGYQNQENQHPNSVPVLMISNFSCKRTSQQPSISSTGDDRNQRRSSGQFKGVRFEDNLAQEQDGSHNDTTSIGNKKVVESQRRYHTDNNEVKRDVCDEQYSPQFRETFRGERDSRESGSFIRYENYPSSHKQIQVKVGLLS